MKHLALLMVLPCIVACNVHPKNPAKSDEKVTIQADDNGHIAFNLPIAEGQVKVPASMMHNGNIDIDGVKLMPGSSVTGFNLDAHDQNAKVDMSFKAPASPDAVRAYYLDEFKKQGVEVAQAGDAVRGKSKDGSVFKIQVSPAPGGSQGKIEVLSND